MDPDRVAVGFAQVLRAAGLGASIDGTATFAAALRIVGWDRADQVYWAARVTLCRRPEDVATFDACFRAWFGDGPVTAEVSTPRDTIARGLDGEDQPVVPEGSDAADEPDSAIRPVRWSAMEVLRTRDFAAYSSEDHAAADRVLRRLRVVGPVRRSARRAASRSGRGRIDLRRTTRAALRTDGEVLRRYRRRPTTRPRRLVVLCDVSGSMEPYSRVIVRFLHAARTARAQVEVFALGTRLTRLTRELATRDADAALAAAARRVQDWSGGTRLGETLHEFNRTWGGRGLADGAVVVVISDGWDRGDPGLLAEQMARVSRRAHRVVWVNPLKAGAGYEPRAAGMAAALPYVDEFLEGHSLQSLEDLVDALAGAAS